MFNFIFDSLMIKYLLILLAGIIIGKIIAYRNNRKQCLNCGSHRTINSCAGLGHGGGKYEFAVKHWEGYYCKNCDATFSAKITLDKS